MLAPDDPRHGTPNGYANLGCRCEACRTVWTTYWREHDYSRAYRDRHLKGKLCAARACRRTPDRAYVTGYCHRHNVELGLKPDRRKAA